MGIDRERVKAETVSVKINQTKIHTAKLVVNGYATSTDEATKAIADAETEIHKALDMLTEVKLTHT